MSSKLKSNVEMTYKGSENKSLQKMVPKRNGLYNNRCPNETVPASYWNNPHICYKEKAPLENRKATKSIIMTHLPKTYVLSTYGTVPASYWNNPHVCDKKKAPAIHQITKRAPWTQLPRWEVRRNIQNKQMVRQERMKEDKDRNQRLRAMKYGLKLPPKPVEGRKNVTLQTCDYLEALYDDPPMTNACTQADLERPLTPPFIPAKTGVDTCTQIYPDDLFFFDEEVKPILEVTTGKTLEQALLEVLNEDEIDGMEREKRRFLEEKDAFEAEVQRIEEEERRKAAETEERIEEVEIAKEAQKELEKRIAAAMLTDQMCRELLPEVLDDMITQGYYVDATEEAVEDVMKVLESDVCEELQRITLSENILGEMIKDIVQERYDVYRELGEHPVERFIHEAPPEEEYEEVEDENEGLMELE